MRTRNRRRGYSNNDVKNRILPIVLLILSIVALTGGSYAWFSSNERVDSKEIEIGVNPSASMKISADATPDSWESTLTIDDIRSADYGYGVVRLNSTPVNYKPVSTVGNVNNGLVDFFLGSIAKANSTQYRIVAKPVVETDGNSGHFTAYDLYIKTAVDQMLQLNVENSGVTFSKQKGDVGLQGIENAFRMAFVYEGNTVEGDTVANIQGMRSSDDGKIVVWEPNDQIHSPYAIDAAKEFYGMTIENGDVLDYQGVKAEIPGDSFEILGNHDPLYFAPLGDKLHRSKSNDLGLIDLFPIKEGISKIRIYIWIEGQDVDCENSAAGTSFEIKINFNSSGTVEG